MINDDPEIAALSTCVDAITPLSSDAQKRVVDYLIERFGKRFTVSHRLPSPDIMATVKGAWPAK